MPEKDVTNLSVTAAFLDSGRVIANAANAAGVVAGIGCFIVGPGYRRGILACSILLWFIECYYAVRVAIDASLFRVLASDPEGAAHAIDNLVQRRGERSLKDRTHGALALWRRQIAFLILQLAALALGVILWLLAASAATLPA